MSSQSAVIMALRGYVAETAIISPQGELMVDPNGKPIVLYVAEAMIALKQLDSAVWEAGPR